MMPNGKNRMRLAMWLSRLQERSAQGIAPWGLTALTVYACRLRTACILAKSFCSLNLTSAGQNALPSVLLDVYVGCCSLLASAKHMTPFCSMLYVHQYKCRRVTETTSIRLADIWQKRTRSIFMQVTMDEVPKDWLPPYEGDGSGDSLFRPESAKRTSSKSSLQPKRQQGMQQVVSSRRSGYLLPSSC